MVSIIVPIYKVESYLPKCIDSILVQTYTDFELILVDDGSPDNCGIICDAYAEKDKRVRVIHQKNAGVSAARNAGIEAAKGEYISFIDGDDYVEKNFLEQALMQFTGTVDLVCFGYRSVNETDSELGRWVHKKEDFRLDTEELRCDFVADQLLRYRVSWEVWNKVFRRNIILENGIRFADNHENFAEDQLFCVCYCLYAKCILCIPDVLYNYVIHVDSIMAKRKGKSYLRQISSMAKMLYAYLESESCRCGLRYFPLFYYLIVRNELQVIRKEQKVDIVQLRNMILSEIPDQSFFFNQLKSVKACRKTLCKLWGKHSGRRELSEIQFLIDGRYTIMRIRNRLIALSSSPAFRKL